MARRTKSDQPPPIADERLLRRRCRWLELHLGCQHAADREPLREPTLERARREAAKTDNLTDRLRLMEDACSKVFGSEFLRHVLREHDDLLERERERRARP